MRPELGRWNQPLVGACHSSLSGSQLPFPAFSERSYSDQDEGKEAVTCLPFCFPNLISGTFPQAYYALHHGSSWFLMELQDPLPSPHPTLLLLPFWLDLVLHGSADTSPLKNSSLGLPCWSSGYESPCQCRGHRFDPWSGKIPQAMEQLNLCATTIEAVL